LGPYQGRAAKIATTSSYVQLSVPSFVLVCFL